jgi:pyruvate, orthophosphate dikinase
VSDTTVRLTARHEAMVQHIEDLDADDVERFGGKGAGLARMVAAGLTVPPAFVIGTDGYRAWRTEGGQVPDALVGEVEGALAALEVQTGRRLGGEHGLPLLVSVRSGAKVSMPGMMDTVLNLGATAGSAHALAAVSGSAHFATDTLLRFWRMFGDIVLQIDAERLATDLENISAVVHREPTKQAFEELERSIVEWVQRQGVTVTVDPRRQLTQAIAAVFDSWQSRRARAYREHHGIPDDLGTAVVVQAMVFGNLDSDSGSGVAFSRNPNTGDRALYGEYLRGCQGEDIVSGAETPLPIEDSAVPSELRIQLDYAARQLETMYRDAVDIEFTVESSVLYLLQVRAAKRSAAAAVKIALELIDEEILDPPAGVRRVSVEQLGRLLKPAFDTSAMDDALVLANGIGSSPGHATGMVVLDADRAAMRVTGGDHVILLRPTTSPQDIRGMLAAEGIVTVRGGALSHAAVVSRALDKPCIVGCESIAVDLAAQTFEIGGQVYPEGTTLSIDGATGIIYSGSLPFQSAIHNAHDVAQLLRLADLVSGCRYWISSVADPTIAAGGLAPAGLGPVSLTDLLITTGHLEQLIGEIDLLSSNPNDAGIQKRLTALTFDACTALLANAGGLDVHIRLPNLGSPRAQRMIGEWASLAPQLLLPMGLRSFHRSLLRGISEAADNARESSVTVILAGVTNRCEPDALAKACRSLGSLSVGVSVQNFGALLAAREFTDNGYPVWIDIMEITRTFFGFPSALSLADDVFESYTSEGLMSFNPRSRVAPPLLEAIGRASTPAPESAEVAADCGAGATPSLVTDLHSVGLRTFSFSPNRSAAVRLALGHTKQKGMS